MSQSCFSLGFLTHNSLWKLSTFRGYKGIYSSVCEEYEKLVFIQIGHSSDSVLRLEPVTSLSCKLITLPDYTFYSVVLQLSWPFSSLCMLHTCATLVTCQSRDSSWVHTSWAFFTLSHTLPLRDFHLNTGLLIAKLQANLAQNKANKMDD